MRSRFKHFALCFTLATFTVTVWAQQPPSQRGTPWRGPAPATELVSAIQARQKITPPKPVKFATIPRRLEKRRDNPQNPAARPEAQWPPRSQALTTQEPIKEGTPSVYAAQTVGTSFTGATLLGINPTLALPPDSMGAVGPTQYIVAVNNRIVSFNKTTGVADGVINATTDVFFNSVRDGKGTSDPRVRYDRLSQRWFFVIINTVLPGHDPSVRPADNRILIAVSNTSTITPSTLFTYFYIPIVSVSPPIPSACFADYPTLGIDAQALYIGTNNFYCDPDPMKPPFSGTDGYVIRKSDLLAGTLTVTVFRGLAPNGSSAGPYTPQGVDNYDPSATEGYFIGVDTITFSTLMLRRVTDPGGTPSISANISIATPLTTSFPITVRHLGNTGGANGRLDALEDRLFAAHIRNGRLWTAHNIAVNNTGVVSNPAQSRTRNAVRWYEMTGIASPGTPSFIQAGTVFTATGNNLTGEVNYWIPSIMVSGQGHAALGFSTAGDNAYINAGTTGRLSTDALGTMQTPLNYTASSTAYNTPYDSGGPNGRRWGDYSYTSLDPNDDMTMWTIQEFCDATDSYAVRIVKLVAPPPATPNAASVFNGIASAPVTLNGTSSAGSGFFDPGAGFTNRLAVSIPGVPVNSLTYVNPTTINLVLNTVGVTAGNYNITVTNPDGQVSNGTLTVNQTVGSTPTTSGLLSNLNPSVFGSLVTFTATVTPSTATGTFTFKNGVTTLGVVTIASGSAVFATSSLTVGAHSITATYDGDPTYASSTSTPVSQTVTEKKRRGQTVSESAKLLEKKSAPQE